MIHIFKKFVITWFLSCRNIRSTFRRSNVLNRSLPSVITPNLACNDSHAGFPHYHIIKRMISHSRHSSLSNSQFLPLWEAHGAGQLALFHRSLLNLSDRSRMSSCPNSYTHQNTFLQKNGAPDPWWIL